MQNKTVVGFYAHSGDTSPELVDFSWRIWKISRKNNCHLRGIVPDHPNLKRFCETDTKYNRLMKTIPMDEYSANISIDIGDDFVSFFLSKIFK